MFFAPRSSNFIMSFNIHNWVYLPAIYDVLMFPFLKTENNNKETYNPPAKTYLMIDVLTVKSKVPKSVLLHNVKLLGTPGSIDSKTSTVTVSDTEQVEFI